MTDDGVKDAAICPDLQNIHMRPGYKPVDKYIGFVLSMRLHPSNFSAY